MLSLWIPSRSKPYRLTSFCIYITQAKHGVIPFSVSQYCQENLNNNICFKEFMMIPTVIRLLAMRILIATRTPPQYLQVSVAKVQPGNTAD
jgi:hypothetical protein